MKIVPALKPFKLKSAVRVDHESEVVQRFYKPCYRHSPVMDKDDLHDSETYCFYEMGSHGSQLRQIPGYRLKYNWKNFPKAQMPKPSEKFLRRSPKQFHGNWVTVNLPNGMQLSVQPRSATRSYYREP